MGYKQIIMKPEMIEGLDFVDASYQTSYGIITSNWSKKKGKFEWNLTVPANTTALVYVPANSVKDVRESSYNFV